MSSPLVRYGDCRTGVSCTSAGESRVLYLNLCVVNAKRHISSDLFKSQPCLHTHTTISGQTVKVREHSCENTLSRRERKGSGSGMEKKPTSTGYMVYLGSHFKQALWRPICDMTCSDKRGTKCQIGYPELLKPTENAIKVD